MSELFGTLLLLTAFGLSAVVIEEKIAPLPKWTGPLFLYLVMPALFCIYGLAIVVAFVP